MHLGLERWLQNIPLTMIFARNKMHTIILSLEVLLTYFSGPANDSREAQNINTKPRVGGRMIDGSLDSSALSSCGAGGWDSMILRVSPSSAVLRSSSSSSTRCFVITSSQVSPSFTDG